MMSSAAIPVESTESRRLKVSSTANGTRRIRFRRSINWFNALFLPFWLYLWAYGWVGVVQWLLSGSLGWASTFVSAWLVLWTLGGGAVATSLLWMFFGEEVIEINLARLTHAYRLLGLQRVRAFDAGQVTELRFEPRAYRRWPLIAFNYGSRTEKICRGISSAEANQVIGVIEEALGRRERHLL